MQVLGQVLGGARAAVAVKHAKEGALRVLAKAELGDVLVLLVGAQALNAHHRGRVSGNDGEGQ